MKYKAPCIDPVRDILEDAADANGLDVIRSDEVPGGAVPLRDSIRQDIDKCLIFVCEGSGFSWIVAYEVSYALERKPSILLLQEPRPACLVPESDVLRLYPDLVHQDYSLRSKGERDQVRSELERILKQQLALVHKLRDRLPRDKVFTPAPIDNYVDHRITWHGKDFYGGGFFNTVIDVEKVTKPLVIVSPPGGGKSFLLAKIIERVADDDHEVKTEECNKPLCVFVNLGIMEDEVTMREDGWPWDMIKRRVCSYSSSGSREDRWLEGMIDTYRSQSLVYLLLDALDEFGMRRKDQVGLMLDKCRELARKGIRVLITSRSWFWEHQVEHKHGFDSAEVLPFDYAQAMQLVRKKKHVVARLRQEKKAKKPTLLYTAGNPLLLSYLLNEDTVLENKAAIYEAWAQDVAKKDIKNIPTKADHVLNFFEALAVILANRTTNDANQAIREEAIGAAVPEDHRDKLTPDRIMSSGFFMPTEKSKVARFKHFSVHEFFVARKLAGDFKRLLDQTKGNDLFRQKKGVKISEFHLPPRTERLFRELALHSTPLDYMGASVYGFLSQLMNPGDNPLAFEERLIEWLASFMASASKAEKCTLLADPSHPLWGVLRNCVEYLGITYDRSLYANSPSVRKSMIDTILSFMTATNLDPIIRYNAARAIERIHPSGPQPYFDFMSDWGSKDWDDFQEDMIVRAYAIRRITSKHGRKPGKSPPLIIDLRRREKHHLESMVGRKLLDIASRRNTDKFVRINCTYALIRWIYDEKDLSKRLKKAVEAAELAGDRYSLENLTKWVPKVWRKYDVKLENFKKETKRRRTSR